MPDIVHLQGKLTVIPNDDQTTRSYSRNRRNEFSKSSAYSRRHPQRKHSRGHSLPDTSRSMDRSLSEATVSDNQEFLLTRGNIYPIQLYMPEKAECIWLKRMFISPRTSRPVVYTSPKHPKKPAESTIKIYPGNTYRTPSRLSSCSSRYTNLTAEEELLPQQLDDIINVRHKREEQDELSYL